MEKSKVEITVKGQTYTIITDDAPEKVLALANGLNTTLDNIMSSGKVTLTQALVLVSLELTVSAVMLKSRLFRKLISGSPVVVIEDGRLLQRQLKRLRLTTDELCAQLRQQNVFSLQDVQYCIVETNGVLSVLEKPSKRVPNAEESGIVIPDNKMEAVVVSDGAWVESSLRLCGSTKQEINNILQKKQIELNEIFLMTMDGNGVCQIIRRENEK